MSNKRLANWLFVGKLCSCALGIALVITAMMYPWGSELRRDLAALSFLFLFAVTNLLGIIVEPIFLMRDEAAKGKDIRFQCTSFQILYLTGMLSPLFLIIRHIENLLFLANTWTGLVFCSVIAVTFLLLATLFITGELLSSVKNKPMALLFSPLIGAAFCVIVLLGLVISMSIFGFIGFFIAWNVNFMSEEKSFVEA